MEATGTWWEMDASVAGRFEGTGRWGPGGGYRAAWRRAKGKRYVCNRPSVV